MTSHSLNKNRGAVQRRVALKTMSGASAAFALVACCILPRPAVADYTLWYSGNWDTPGNWSNGVLPTATAHTYVDNNLTVSLTPGGWGTANWLYIGNTGTGTLDINGGTLTDADGYLGTYAGSHGMATVTSGTWVNSGDLVVGNAGTGTLVINGGTVMDNTGWVGNNGGSSGTVTITSGTWTNSNDLYVGMTGTGTLNINGGTVTDTNGYIGYDDNGSPVGVVNVTSGTWNNSITLCIGNTAKGTLNISGGAVTSSFGCIGWNQGATGTVNINGGTWTNNDLVVGNFGSGALNISGGTVTSGSSVIGYKMGSSGVTTITSGVWNNSSVLYVADSGTGALNLYGGAVTVASGTGTLTLASQAGSTGTLNIGNGSGAGILNVSRVAAGNGVARVNFNLANSYSFAPILSGSLSVNKIGPGILTLLGNNSYSGGTTVSGGGTLEISSDAQLGTVPATPTVNVTLDGGMLMNSNSAVTLNANRIIDLGPNGGYIRAGYGQVFAVNGNINGEGSLGVAWDGGVVLLNGTNSYLGSTTIGTTTISYWNDPDSTPTLRLGNSYILQGTDLIFGTALNNRATLDMNGFNAVVGVLSGSTNALVANYGGGMSTLTVGADNTNSTFQGTIYGAVSLVKTGTGSLTLTGSNNYFGGTTIKSGTLTLDGSGSLATTGVVTISGANTTLQFNGNTTSAGQTINIDGNDSAVQFNNFSTAGNANISTNNVNSYIRFLDSSSAANVTITATGINSGALFYNASTAGSSTINLAGSGPGAMFFDSSTAGQSTIIANGTNTFVEFSGSSTGGNARIVLNNPTSYLDVSTLAHGSSITLGSLEGSGTARLGSQNLTVGSNGMNTTFSGVIEDGGIGGGTHASITKTGAGAFTLSGSNSYTGGTALEAGSLRLGSLGALGTTGTISFGGGTLQYGADNTFDYSSRFSTAANQQYNVNTSGQNVTWATGLASSGGSLTKLGSGTLMLIANNTYNGGTTINAGTLQLGDGSNFNGWVSGDITNNGTLVFANPSTQTYNGIISGVGAVVKTGTGLMTLGGSNTYGGGTTVSGSGVLQISSDAQLGAVPGSPTTNITLNGGLLINYGSDVTLGANRNVSLGANGGYIEAGYSSSYIINGQISGIGGLGVAWDTGVVVLNGSNSYEGPTTIGSTAIRSWTGGGSQAVLQLGNSHALPGTDLIFSTYLSSPATLEMNGFNATVAALSGGANASVDINDGNASTLIVGHNNASSTFQGVLRNTIGVLNLTKIGAGTLTLAGANSFNGATTINDGALHLSNQQALQNSTVTMNGGGLVFDSAVSGHAFNFGGLAASSSGAGYDISLQDNSATPNAVGLRVGSNNANTTYAGTLRGSGSLTKVGSGLLILTGNNSYSGGTTISSGTLQLGDGSNFNGSVSGNIIDNAALVFANPNAQTYAGAISGGGHLIKMGAGALTLTGSNTYTQGTTVRGGQLNVDSSNNLGSGSLTLGGSDAGNPAALHYGTSNSTLSVGALTLNGFSTIDLQANSAIQSSGAVIINGVGNSIALWGDTWNLGTNTLLSGTFLGFGSESAISLTGEAINNQTLTLGSTTIIGRTSYTFGYNANSLYLLAAGVSIDLVWTGAENNQWDTTSTNWQGSTGGLNPSGSNIAFASADNVYFNNAATGISVTNAGVQAAEVVVSNTSGTVSLNGGSISANNLTKSGSGDLTISNAILLSGTFLNTGNGAVTLAGAVSGEQLNQNGNGTLTLSGTSTYTGAITVSSGTLMVSGSGAITQSNSITVDSAAPATNATLVVDGTGSSVSTAGNLMVGSYDVGTLSITNGGTVTNQRADIGYASGAKGTATVSGAGSTWINNQTLFLGSLNASSNGTVNITTGGTLRTKGIIVGCTGVGALNITDGGVVTNIGENGDGYIGDDVESNGTVTVDGVGSTWTTPTGGLFVGYYGNGVLNITNGGVVTSVYSGLGINAGSSGTVTVDGAGSTWTNDNLHVGISGTGTLNIVSGGVVNVDGNLTLATNVGSVGTLNIGNGTGAGELNAVAVIGGAGSSTVNFNHSDSNYTFAPQLTGSLSVNQIGSGTTILTGTNSYTGATAIKNGALQVSGGASITQSSNITVDSVTPATNATLSVDGSASSISSTGDLTVGNYNTGTLNITNGSKVATESGFIGYQPGANGSAEVSGIGSTWTNQGTIEVGKMGTGTLSVINGGTVSTNSIYVGETGIGTLSITSGGSVASQNGIIGSQPGSNGTVDVSGAGSTWTSDQAIALGVEGSGTLSIRNGGAVSTNSIYVGEGGSGMLRITNSGEFVSQNGYIGWSLGSNGAATVDGVGSTWTNAGLFVGYYGTSAKLDITNGGTVTAQNSNSYIGYDAGSNGTVTVDGAGSAWTNSNLFVGASGTGTLNIVSGGVVNVGGNLTLAANVGSVGILNIGNGTGAGALNAAVTGGSGTAVVNFNHSNSAYIFAPQIMGIIAVNQIGSGTTILTGANTYTGVTNIAAGALSFAAGSLGTAGTVDITGNSTLQWYGVNTQDISSRLKIEDGITASIDTNGNDVTFASALQTGTNQTGALTKVGAGTLALTATNIYTGATTVSNGTLQVSGGGAITQTNSITVDSVAPATSATLTVDGSTSIVTSLGSVTIGDTGTGTLNVQDGGVVNVGGILGTGTLILANSNGSFGTLNIGNGNGAGVLNASAVTGGSGTAIVNFNHSDLGHEFATQINGAIAVNQIGFGTTILTGTNAYTGATTVNAGTLQVSGSGAITQTSSITIDSMAPAISAALTVDGILSSVTSAGNFIVGNFGSGTLNIQNGGVVNVVGSSGTGVLMLANSAGSVGTLNIGNGNGAGTLNALAVTGGSGTAIVNFNHSDPGYSFALPITGAITVNQIGSGMTILTAANTYTGITNISAGTLNLSNQNAVQNSTITMNGGSLGFDSSVTGHAFTVGGLAASSSGPGYDIALQDNAALPNAVALSVGNNNASTVYAGSLSGPGSLTKIGTGTLSLTGSSNYTGGSNIVAGTLSFANGALGAVGTVDFIGNSTLQWSGTNTQDISSRLKIEDGITASIDTNGNNVIFASALLTGNNKTGALTKIGAGTLALTATNNYTGGSNIVAGTLSFANGALGTVGTVDFTGNSTLQWSGTNTQDISSRLKIEDGITASIDTNGNDVIFANTLQTGSGQTGALTKTGAGKLTMTSLGSYRGGTNINEGTLSFDVWSLGNTGTVDFIGSSILQWYGTNTQDISSRLKIEDGITASIDTNGNNVTFASALQTGTSQTGALSKIGAGTLTLTATNTYTGATTVNEGTLQVSNGGAITQTSSITVDSVAPASTAMLTVDGTTSSVTSQGAVVIGNASVGVLNVQNGGVVNIGSAGTENLILANSFGSTGTLNIGNGGDIGTLNAAVVTGGSGSAIVNFNHNNYGYIFVPQIAGSIAVNQIGVGTTILTGTETYTGATTVSAGTMEVSGGGTITQTSSLTVDSVAPASNATFTIDGATLSSVTALGTLTVGGTSVGTLNITNGGTLTNDTGYIGYEAGADGIVTVSGSSSIWTNNSSLNIGYKGNGTGVLSVINGGTVTSGTGYLGYDTEAVGTVTVSGTSSSWTNAGDLNIGYSDNATGTLNITDGGSVTNGSGYLGYAGGASGTVTVSGANSTWTNNGNLNIGYNSNIVSTLSIKNGGAVTSGTGYIGYGVGANGTVSVSDVDSSWTNSGDLYVGYNGTGALEIKSGGKVTDAAKGYIGYAATSVGTVTVSGTATWKNTGDLNVGYNGTGSLNVVDESNLTSGIGYIGTNAGSSGTVTISGTSTWNTGSDGLYVGNSGSGTLNVMDGSTLTSGESYIGNNAGSNGTITVSGASTWINGGKLYIGYSGTGTVNVNGSTVSAETGNNNMPKDLYVGYNGTGVGTLNINDSTVYSDSGNIGDNAGSHGTVTLSGNSTWQITLGSLTVGNKGTGALTINNGSKVTNGAGYISTNDGSTGTVTVSGGTWKNEASLYVGNDTTNGTGGGHATLSILDGGSVTSYNGIVGGTNSVVTVSGKDSSWEIFDPHYISGKIEGMLEVYAGSALNIADGGKVSVDKQCAIIGTATVDNGTWKNADIFAVGGGTVSITNGGKVFAKSVLISKNGGIGGTIAVDGKDSYLWYTPKDIITHPLPDSDNSLKIEGGTLSVTNGGQVTFDSTTISHDGTLMMDGKDSSGLASTLTISKGFDVKTGTLTVQNGATVMIGGYLLEGTLNIGKDPGDNAVVNLANGGILNTNDGNGFVYMGTMGGTATLNITGTVGGILKASHLDGTSDTTVNFNHSDPNYAFNLTLEGNMPLNQNGTGSTSLTYQNTQYVGVATINAGTLKLSNTYAAYQGIVKMNGGRLAFDSSVSGHAFTIGGLVAGSSGGDYNVVLEDTAGNAVALSLGANNGDTTYAGVLSGSGSLTKVSFIDSFNDDMADAGTVTLAGANTFTGATTITAGTLCLSNQNAVQNSTVTINDYKGMKTNKGGTLIFDSLVSGHAFTFGGLSESSGYGIALHDNANNAVALSVGNNNTSTSFAGVLSGEGSLIKIGNGTLTLTEKNTYSGGTIVNSGTLVLSGANECSGTTTLSGGALKLSNQNAVQNSTVTPDGGSLVFDSAVTGHAFTFGGLAASNVAYNIKLQDDAGNAVTLTVGNNNENTAYAAILSGSGSLVKSGTGTLVLLGKGLYSGATTVNNGALAIVGGLIKETSSVTVDSVGAATDATLTVDGSIDGSVTALGNATVGESGTGTLNIQNGGVVTLGGIYGTGTLTLASAAGSAGTLNIIDNGANLPGMLSAAVVTGGSGTAIINFNHSDPFYSFAPQLRGAITVNQIGVGTTILSNANTYTGTTNINAGTLKLSNQNAVQNSTVTMNGGSLVFDSSVYQHAFTFGGLAASSSGPGYDIALNDNGTPSNAVALTVGNNNADTLYAGVLSGSGSLTKIGTGTLAFSGTNTYTGATTVNGGTLMVSDGGMIAQTSSVIVDSMGAATNAVLTINGTPSSVTSMGNATVGNSGTGTLNIQNGGVVNVGGSAGTGTLSLARNAGSAGTLNIGNGGSAGILNATVVTGGSGTAIVNFNHNDPSYSFAPQINGTITVNQVGGGTTILTGENTYNGGTNLNAGTLSLGSSGAIGNTGTISFGGGTLQYTESNTIDYSDRFSTAAGQLYDVDTNGQNVTWATALTSSAGSLTKSGSGMLTLTGANNYTGGTTINAGTLRMASGGALAATGTVTLSGDASSLQFTGATTAASTTINANGTGSVVLFSNSSTAGNAHINANGAGSLVLFSDSSTGGNASVALVNSTSFADISYLNSSAMTFASLEGSGTAYLGKNNLTVGGNGQNKTFSGSIADGGANAGVGGSITKTGTGSWTLAGTSTFTGSTSVAQGALIVSGSLNTTSSVVVAPGSLLSVAQGGMVNSAAPVALSGTLSGAGSVGAVIAKGGVIAPGILGSPLTVNGSISMDATSSFQFTLGSTTGSHDALLSGTITLASGASLVLADPYKVGTNFVFGDTIKLFGDLNGDAPNFVGMFENLTLPTLIDDLYWSTADLYTEGQLEVVPEPNTLFMLIGGLGTMLLAQRLRRGAHGGAQPSSNQ